MANLNRVLLIGNLTRDPELRYTPSGSAVAEFGMAMNRFWKGQDGSRQEETTFVDVTSWGRQAELANQYLTKGRRVFVEGRLKLDQWTTPDGQKRSKLSVVAENIQFLDSRGEGGPPQQGAGGYGGGRSQQGGYGGPSGPQGGGYGGPESQSDYGGPDDYGGPTGEDIPF
jgi:single-strand DNA-binding protein